MKRAFTGGCHCGALRFEVELEVAAGSIKCNCSYCAKSRFWHARAEIGEFRAVGDSTDYRGRNPVAHHFFCPQCGVHTHDRINMPNGLGRAYINVSIVCLNDLDVDAWMSTPIRSCDGLNDNWASSPIETRHL